MKCLLGMMGLDVHSKGIRTLARLLREVGHEVIYVGEHNSEVAIVRAAVEEDVGVIGLSFSSAGYVDHVRRLMATLEAADAGDIAVIVGGLIHDEDIEGLEKFGVRRVFGPRTTTVDVTDFLAALDEDASHAQRPPRPKP